MTSSSSPVSTSQQTNDLLSQPPTSSSLEFPSSETDSEQDKTKTGGILGGWEEKRGFYLRSADDTFNLRLTGQIQADYRAFLDGIDTDGFEVGNGAHAERRS